MRLRSRLVLAATGVTFAITIVLSMLFVSELLRQRVAQTAAANEVTARQVLMMTRRSLETGLAERPPASATPEALNAAVAQALRTSAALTDTMAGFVLYNPAVQDVSVVDTRGVTLVSTDPTAVNGPAATRVSFNLVRDEGVVRQARDVFGKPRVLDVAAPLNRNGVPFLVVHVGIRSSFLRNNYIPWIKGAFWLALIAGLISIGAAWLLVRVTVAPAATRMEQELEVSRRLAAVGRLTAGVGHEVKNPINAMVVHLELLRGKLEVAGQGRSFLSGAMRHVEILSGEMQRLDRVVQTLADFTRPMELRVERLDLCDVAEAVMELSGAEMAEYGVRVETALESVMVQGDGELLRQAVLNLVLNGMQAIAETGRTAGKRLLITVRRDHDAGVVQVCDEGQGIAAEVLPHIYDLYFTTKAKGSGIGLAMTYRIVQMHGGSMNVASEEGHGAVFTVRLPAVTRASLRGGVEMLTGRLA